MGSATMVMPSLSIAAPFRPHMGSEVGGGTRFGVIPESQWPALPAQHGIMSDDAFAIGNSGAINDRATKRHKRHNMARWSCLCFMNFFGAMAVYLDTWLRRHRFFNQFHFALRTGTRGFRSHVLVHGADVVEPGRFIRVGRMFLLRCCEDDDRITARPNNKQGGRGERQDPKS